MYCIRLFFIGGIFFCFFSTYEQTKGAACVSCNKLSRGEYYDKCSNNNDPEFVGPSFHVCRKQECELTDKMFEEYSKWSPKIKKRHTISSYETNNFFFFSQKEIADISHEVNSILSKEIDYSCFEKASILGRNYYCEIEQKKYVSLKSCQKQNGEYQNKEEILEKSCKNVCVNEKYVYVTARAFHDVASCFDLTLKEKQILFALINHESKFQVNVWADGDAYCYGQVLKVAREDVARFTVGSMSKFKNTNFSNTLSLVKKNCPQSLELIKNVENEGKDKKTVACHILFNPHACFLYSFFMFKLNEKHYIPSYFNNPIYHQGYLSEIPFESLNEEIKTYIKFSSYKQGREAVLGAISVFIKFLKNGNKVKDISFESFRQEFESLFSDRTDKLYVQNIKEDIETIAQTQGPECNFANIIPPFSSY